MKCSCKCAKIYLQVPTCFSPSFSSFPGGVPFRRRGIWPCSSVDRAPQQLCGGNGSIPFKARCTRTFRVFIFLLTPRKDGEMILPHKPTGVRHPKQRPQGHGADCGKTLYRRLTVPNYAPEKGKRRPVCSTGSVGGCNDPQQAGNRLYMPPCGCTRRRRH